MIEQEKLELLKTDNNTVMFGQWNPENGLDYNDNMKCFEFLFWVEYETIIEVYNYQLKKVNTILKPFDYSSVIEVSKL